MRLGLIGAGAMGEAILKGACQAHALAPKQTWIFDARDEAAQDLAEQLGAHRCTSAQQLAEQLADAPQPQHAKEQDRQVSLLLCAVKPHQLRAALSDLGLSPSTVVVSIAAGRSLAWLADCLPPDQPAIRVMPNVNAQIGQGMAALAAGSTVTPDQLAAALALFRSVGQAIELPEEHFPVYSALAGCSPAWVFRFIDALAQAAVSHGMTKAQATRCAAQAVAGSGHLALAALDEGRVPQQLVDMVCSPGGTTVAGLLAAEDAGFSAAVRASLNAAVHQDGQLGKQE